MSNNVVTLPFDDLAEVDTAVAAQQQKEAVQEFMGDFTDWCENRGIDISTNEYRHQAAVIMTQIQIILMGAK